MLDLLKETVRSFTAHGGRVLGAATALYALLSVAPMLLMAVWITSFVVDEERARANIVRDVALWIGDDGGRVLADVLRNLDESGGGALAGTVSVVTLLWASTRLFAQLRYSLNHLWGVRETRPRAWSAKALRQVRRRLTALAMVVVVVTVLVATVLSKIALSATEAWLGTPLHTRWHLLDLAASFLLLNLLFAAVFKILPAVTVSWRDAWIGALVTALLFSAGAAAVGWYLGFKGTRSTYGAAGSVVAMLLWVYYSSQAFFLGAAFTRAWAERYGGGLPLDPGAVRIVEETARPPEVAADRTDA
ncbi:MAG TPA: YihY/virulence factor BrkB family protein [Sandaracinaceae bacterium LLY-WYZ-13_1]|nr:YihY/virulence factor BrkB family protein [Sandaracinaceae bacterium LLY-WYZ-13_1]